MDGSVAAAIRRKLNGEHVRPLLATRKLALSTSLLTILWAFIGLAFLLYNFFVTYFLQTRGVDFGDGSIYITYQNVSASVRGDLLLTDRYPLIASHVVGVPGALHAGWMVELPCLGRKGTIAISTRKPGLFLRSARLLTKASINPLAVPLHIRPMPCWAGTAATVSHPTPCVVYPTLSPPSSSPPRTVVPVIPSSPPQTEFSESWHPNVALYADLATSIPIYVSGALFIVSGLSCLSSVGGRRQCDRMELT